MSSRVYAAVLSKRQEGREEDGRLMAPGLRAAEGFAKSRET